MKPIANFENGASQSPSGAPAIRSENLVLRATLNYRAVAIVRMIHGFGFGLSHQQFNQLFLVNHSDAEREREHGHGKARMLQQLAEGEFQIVHDG
jgi:hypothetical protein